MLTVRADSIGNQTVEQFYPLLTPDFVSVEAPIDWIFPIAATLDVSPIATLLSGKVIKTLLCLSELIGWAHQYQSS